jgi:antitoxin CcdA
MALRSRSPKREVQLQLNSKILDRTQELGMDVSETVDELLAEVVNKRYWERWNEDNKEAIAAYNERIEREGIPLARYRTFMRGS